MSWLKKGQDKWTWTAQTICRDARGGGPNVSTTDGPHSSIWLSGTSFISVATACEFVLQVTRQGSGEIQYWSFNIFFLCMSQTKLFCVRACVRLSFLSSKAEGCMNLRVRQNVRQYNQGTRRKQGRPRIANLHFEGWNLGRATFVSTPAHAHLPCSYSASFKHSVYIVFFPRETALTILLLFMLVKLKVQYSDNDKG